MFYAREKANMLMLCVLVDVSHSLCSMAGIIEEFLILMIYSARNNNQSLANFPNEFNIWPTIIHLG